MAENKNYENMSGMTQNDKPTKNYHLIVAAGRSL